MRTMFTLALLAALAPATLAGHEIDWFTADAGGGKSSGGRYAVFGAVGQPDGAPTLAGGRYELAGGFWPAALAEDDCPVDRNGDGLATVADLIAFLGDFAAGNADMDGDGQTTVADLIAFLQAFGAGC